MIHPVYDICELSYSFSPTVDRFISPQIRYSLASEDKTVKKLEKYVYFKRRLTHTHTSCEFMVLRDFHDLIYIIIYYCFIIGQMNSDNFRRQMYFFCRFGENLVNITQIPVNKKNNLTTHITVKHSI